MERVLVLSVALWAGAAPAQVRTEAEQVRGRMAWLASAGAVLTLGGAAVLGLGLVDRKQPVGGPAYARSTHEVVGGVALLLFGAHVGLLSLCGALWPMGLWAVPAPLPGGGGGLWVQGGWP